MASDDIRVEVEGFEEFQRAMERGAQLMRGSEITNAMRDITLLVQRDAKLNVPVDTGRLRASIIPVVETIGQQIHGIVGTNVVYGPAMEKPGPVRASGRRPWLRPAVEDNQAKIEQRLARALVGIFEG